MPSKHIQLSQGHLEGHWWFRSAGVVSNTFCQITGSAMRRLRHLRFDQYSKRKHRQSLRRQQATYRSGSTSHILAPALWSPALLTSAQHTMITGRSLQSSLHRNANVRVAGHSSSSSCSRRLRVRVQAGSEPTITVKFVEEGQQPVTIECISGEEQLRAAMLDNKGEQQLPSMHPCQAAVHWLCSDASDVSCSSCCSSCSAFFENTSSSKRACKFLEA